MQLFVAVSCMVEGVLAFIEGWHASCTVSHTFTASYPCDRYISHPTSYPLIMELVRSTRPKLAVKKFHLGGAKKCSFENLHASWKYISILNNLVCTVKVFKKLNDMYFTRPGFNSMVHMFNFKGWVEFLIWMFWNIWN